MTYEIGTVGSDAEEREALAMIRKRREEATDPKRQAELALDRLARKRAAATGQSFHRAYDDVVQEETGLYHVAKFGAQAIEDAFGDVATEVAKIRAIGV